MRKAAFASTEHRYDVQPAPAERRTFAQPCDVHEYIEPGCADCTKLSAIPVSDEVGRLREENARMTAALGLLAGNGGAAYGDGDWVRETARQALNSDPE